MKVRRHSSKRGLKPYKLQGTTFVCGWVCLGVCVYVYVCVDGVYVDAVYRCVCVDAVCGWVCTVVCVCVCVVSLGV